MANSKVLDLGKCNSSFGLNLFKKLAAEKKDENIFFSPYSISCALAMTSLGAKNDTLQQLRSALKVNSIPEQDVHKLFSELNESILGNSSRCTLHVANRLYGEKSYKFKKEFLQDCTQFYGAELAAVDFRNNTSECEREINAWVSVQTKDKIKDLIQSGSLDSLTTLILINAIYFKGDWNKKFETSDTKESDFHVSKNNSVKVQMMHLKEEELKYEMNDKLNCQVLELSYVGNSISMVILLPDLTKTSLDNLESSLTSQDLCDLHPWKRDVNLWMPRFKVEQDFDLNNVLNDLGATDLFARGSADLSGMDGSRDLYVSKVIHKAFIEVNEEGSEAAAATAVQFMLCCAVIPSPPVEFRADHPFIYFLRDNKTRSILFYGRLSKP